MERHNSNARNRTFNGTLNGSNLTPANIPANRTLFDQEKVASDSMIDLNVPYIPDSFEVYELDMNARIHNQQCFYRRKRKEPNNTSMNLHQSSRLRDYARGEISMYETSRTVSDFVSSIRNTDPIPSENLRENQLSVEMHGTSTINSQLYTNFSQSSYPISARFQDLIQRNSSSRLQSPSHVRWLDNSSFLETPSISHIPVSNNATSTLQLHNLWHTPTTSHSQSTQLLGASRIALMANNTNLTFSEQHTDFHGGSSYASRNDSNTFIQPSSTHMMMRDFSESTLRYQLNIVIQPSNGSMRYLRANEVAETRRATNFLRNDIDPSPLSLVIGESNVAAVNRERILSAVGSIREPGHRDDPIIIEGDEEDDHGDVQQGVIFYNGNLSYEALLALQERIGDVETGLKKKFIFEMLKQRKYHSTNMNDCSDSCCICLDTYDDGEALGKIDCDHEFHYHCIRKWLKIKNSCPICKRTALTP